MDTTRQLRIGRLIQKELGDIFLKETKKMKGVIVSVTATKVSPDLAIAKSYLSVFPSDQSTEIIENINSQAKEIRFELGKRMGKQLRIIPELQFFKDDSLDYAENIDRLLNDNSSEE